MSRTAPRALVLAALLLVAPTLLGGIANGNLLTGTASAQGQPAWSLSLSVDRDAGFAFTSVRSGGDVPARTSGSFDLAASTLTMRYISPPPSQVENVEPRVVNATLTLSSVYEFRDVNGNDRFDLGDDVVRATPIEAARQARVDRIDGPGLIEGARATYPIEDLGQVIFELRTAARPEPLGYRTVQPPGPIFDLHLEGVQAAAPDTHLALLLRIGGDTIEHPEPRTLEVAGDGALALYDWRGNATVDGSDVATGETILRQRVDDASGSHEDALVILSTPQGERIHHASSMGFDHERSLQESLIAQVKGSLPLFLFGLSVTVVLIGAAAIHKLGVDSDERTS